MGALERITDKARGFTNIAPTSSAWPARGRAQTRRALALVLTSGLACGLGAGAIAAQGRIAIEPPPDHPDQPTPAPQPTPSPEERPSTPPSDAQPAPGTQPPADAQPQNPAPGGAPTPSATPPTPAPPVGPVVPTAKPGSANPAKGKEPTAPAPPPAPTPTAQPVAGGAPAGNAPTPGAPAAVPKGAASDHAHAPVVDEAPDGTFRFGPFADGVEMRLLVDLAIERLKIQVITTDAAVGTLSKKVYLSVPVSVPEETLLDFLTMLLEQNGASMARDVAGIYIIKGPSENYGGIGSDRFDSTQIIPTRGLRPSALSQAVNQIISGGPVAPGQQAGGGNVSYLDDLGIILMTASPRKIDLVKQLVSTLVGEQSKQDIHYFELKYIAAPVARQRVLELLGRGGTRGFNDPNAGVQAQPGQPGAAGSNLSNLADRLIPDPQSNSLIFRGREDEQAFLARLLSVVDTPNKLTPVWYPIGSAASTIAQHGQRQGLGQIVTLPNQRDGGTGGGGSNFNFNNQQFNPNNPNGANAFGGNNGQLSGEQGGSMFLLDPEGRGFVYYGTPEQQDEVKRLADALKSLIEAESVTFEFYKLRHSKAEDVAGIIQELLSGQQRATSSGSPLTPGTSGGSGTRNPVRDILRRETGTAANPNQATTPDTTAAGGTGGGRGTTSAPGEIGALTQTEDIHVGADKVNNQIFVKAPKKLQKQFANLIDKLDLRRPQVYIDAKIISISATDSFRLAFETQLINAAGRGGAFNTNFGLSSFASGTGTSATNGAFTSAKNVATGLGGITAALIKSEYVPIIINATARDLDTRILATPQLLVDDNEEAEVSSLDQRPTTTQSQSGNAGSTLTGFGGFEPAGPKLKVTPQISEGNYLKLEYEIELSSFQGDSQTVGNSVIPPAKLENKIKSKSVTVPSDSTIVVGGLTFTQTDNTVVKVPLLGDIPLVGQLFRDQQKTDSNRTLYIFITPRIMRDPTFNDLRLLTRGPQDTLKPNERGNLPTTKPVRIDVLDRPAPGMLPTGATPNPPITNPPITNPPAANPPAPPASSGAQTEGSR